MALATEDDVEAALGRSFTEDVAVLLESASDLVINYLGGEPDPVPGAVTRVVADVVAGVLSRPEVTTADYGAGGYNSIREATTVRVGAEYPTTTGPWLTKSQKARLNPHRISGGSVSVALASEVLGSDLSFDVNEICDPYTGGDL
jgi:hypothetical protein